MKIDIIKDSYIPPTSMKQIEYSHEEFKHEKAAIRIYTLESVAVDKICRILSVDTEPRDLYDLWFLLKLDVSAGNINEGLKKKFGYNFHYPGLIGAIGEDDYKKNWEIRLTQQIAGLPPFGLVLDELEEFIVTKLSSF